VVGIPVIVSSTQQPLPAFIPLPAEGGGDLIGALIIPPDVLPPGSLVYVAPARELDDNRVQSLSLVIDVQASLPSGDSIHDFSDRGNVEICFEVSDQPDEVRGRRERRRLNRINAYSYLF
jgi:hypothetical protein